MKEIASYFKWIIIIFLLGVMPGFALTCPSVSLIKEVIFLKTTQHAYDPELWTLFSEVFTYEDKSWNIVFGKFFYDKISESEILNQGQAFFKEASVKREKPIPHWIPSGLVCDYMTEGSSYFIAAVSPPQWQ